MVCHNLIFAGLVEVVWFSCFGVVWVLGCCVVDVVWRSGLLVWVVLRFLVLEFTAVWVLVGFVLVRLCSWFCGVWLEFGF